MTDYKLVPMECAIRALARHVYNDGHSAPQVTTPADRYLNQCVTALGISYAATASTVVPLIRGHGQKVEQPMPMSGKG